MTIQPVGFSDGWSLSFEDTFRNGINPSVWDYKYINGDTHDDEQTQYVKANVVSASDGAHLYVKKETAPDGRPYTGGMLDSYPGLNISPPAYIEARIKAAGGVGSWPAYWLLNKDRYPPEVDIFEILNGSSTDNIHYHGPNNYDAYSTSYENGVSLADDFHVYGFNYKGGTNGMEFYVDGKKVGSTNADPITDPLYITINNTVGANGSYSGPPDSSSTFPTDMVVDYVRVWKPSSTPIPTPTPTPTPLPRPMPEPDTSKKVGLFVGIESFGWSMQNFDTLVSFCKSHQIDQIVLKIYEITQGEWYSNLGGAKAVVDRIQSQGIDVLPYGFFYGIDTVTEVNATKKYLNMFGKFCLDMEGGFDNKPDNARAFSDGLNQTDGIIYVSTWANPISHGWSANIGILDDIVSVWMPQVYTDGLVKEMYAQFPKVKGKIWPTFHVVNTPYQDASIYHNITLWEYQLAQQDTASLTNYVNQIEGKTVSTYPTNSKGMIANYLPVSEFQPGHSEFECGAFAVALNQRATNYNVPNHNSPANLVTYAENLYTLTTGSNGPGNSIGASVDDMHRMIKNTQSYAPPGLHYWDTDISPTTQQEHDIATIKAALQHGYPVIATVSEQSVFDMDLGRNPYWWSAAFNHIITYVGIASDGNLLAVDPANVAQGDGNLQTPKTPLTWPRRYDIRRLDNQWATIIQPPWLPPIPSGDPISWPPYSGTTPPVPTPQPSETVQIIYDPNSKQLIFMSENTAVYRIQL